MRIETIGNATLYHGDCLDVMAGLSDASVDMILCDLPYGTTACKWDTVIPFEPLWEQYRRVAKRNAAIVLTASQPFTARLVMSNIQQFRYQWVWEKSKASNFLLARKQPLKAHEDVLVFSKETPAYFPQKEAGKPFKGAGRSKKGSKSDVVNDVPNPTFRNDNIGDRFPRSVQYFKTAETENVGALHPTQKPVALMEYLIRTYTREGETVLDNCMGSGTTGVAAMNLQREFIGIEREPKYFDIACVRLSDGLCSARERKHMRCNDVVTLTGEEYDALIADKERIDWLESEAAVSRTGVTVDYRKHVEDGCVLENGYRLMRYHKIFEARSSLRLAIDVATGDA